MTLEEAQQKILDLTEENQNLKTEKETLSGENKTLKEDNENLRTINQKYFNKLLAQETPEKPEDEEESDEVQSCEEFAKTITI